MWVQPVHPGPRRQGSGRGRRARRGSTRRGRAGVALAAEPTASSPAPGLDRDPHSLLPPRRGTLGHRRPPWGSDEEQVRASVRGKGWKGEGKREAAAREAPWGLALLRGLVESWTEYQVSHKP